MNEQLINALVRDADLVGAELEGLDGLGETFPTIQWVNDKKSMIGDERVKRGGFVVTETNADAAGDIPVGAKVNRIEFSPTPENPTGSEEDCFYTETLTIAPLGMRRGWFVNGQRLPADFDWDATAADGSKPASRVQIHALVKGERGVFLARLSLRSTVARDLQAALSEHNRNVQTALRKAGIKNKAVKTNGWRWFWLTLTAGEPVMRGQTGAQSVVTPVVYGATGDYIGDLRVEHFDVEFIKGFENSWKTAEPPAEVAPTAPAMPEEPPFDNENYPEF